MVRHLSDNRALQLYIQIAVLFGVTFLAGSHGVGAIRLVYILGCVVLAYRALRLGVAYHFELLIMLFCFSPFLRRIVDYAAGYNDQAIMLVGPLLAALLPTISLPSALLAKRGPLAGGIAPYLVLFGGLLYAALLTELFGHFAAVVVPLVKGSATLLYGVWLISALEDPRQLLRQGTRALTIAMPIVGLYGIYQFLAPPPSDQYWMLNTKINTVGTPEPGGVRVFSTMNSPQSLGIYLVCGLMYIGFLGNIPALLIACPPAAVALLLSQARSWWIAIAISIGFTMFFSTTVRRATALTVILAVVGTFAVVATPLGDVIAARLQTIAGSPSDDGSAKVRLQEIVFIFQHAENYLVGRGEDASDMSELNEGNLVVQAQDGVVVITITAMGMIVGLIYLFAVIWVAVKAVSGIDRKADLEYVIAASLILGMLIISPLSDVTSGESGFLFWGLIAAVTRAPSAAARRRERATIAPATRLAEL